MVWGAGSGPTASIYLIQGGFDGLGSGVGAYRFMLEQNLGKTMLEFQVKLYLSMHLFYLKRIAVHFRFF